MDLIPRGHHGSGRKRRGDDGERTVPRQGLRYQLRREALVDEDGLRLAEQLGGRLRDPGLLRYVAHGAGLEGRLEPGALHRVGAAVRATYEPVLLEDPQIAADGLQGDLQLLCQSDDFHCSLTAGDRENRMATVFGCHSPHHFDAREAPGRRPGPRWMPERPNHDP